MFFNNNKFGWINTSWETTTRFCLFADHNKVANEFGFFDSHEAMVKGSWVRFGTRDNSFGEIIMSVEGTERGFQINEDHILDLAASVGASTTEWKDCEK
tara:strand:+ start:939 stop:1235 length:297 start_codon:yes stop_codon:yes gene_type:complete